VVTESVRNVFRTTAEAADVRPFTVEGRGPGPSLLSGTGPSVPTAKESPGILSHMSTDEERKEPIERRVGEVLSNAGATVALAESCTGGLIASLLTDVPGASEYVDRSLVAYAYDAHRTLLGVSREALDAHGTVSEESARQMAQAARDGADTTWGLAATGVLGPGGGTPQKPVGTVFVGVAYAGAWGSGTSGTSVRRYTLEGNRREMKERLARKALGDLHEAILAR